MPAKTDDLAEDENNQDNIPDHGASQNAAQLAAKGTKDEKSIIHPDDVVITGSADGCVKIWMISKGECVHVRYTKQGLGSFQD